MAFRGRGRGRGAPPPRHDIQLPEHEQESDVPVTFPKIPEKYVPAKAKDAQLSAQQQRLLMRFTKMRMWYRKSPYFLDTDASGQVDEVKGSTPNVAKYEDEVNVTTNPQTSSQPLHEVITMHEKYLPKELFSEKEQKKSLRARKSRPKASMKPEADMDLMQLQKEGADGEKEDGDEDGDDKDKEGEAQEEEDDDDEFDHEDDDYYQGEHYDDDEEYGGDADDGEGEAYF
eukprot:jgi/Ulvmu1/10388/UM061_0072.1